MKVDSACVKYIKEQVKKNETDNNITTIKAFNCDINEVVEAKDNSGEALGYIVTVTDNEAYDGSLQMTVGIKMTVRFLVFHFYLYLKHLDLV